MLGCPFWFFVCFRFALVIDFRSICAGYYGFFGLFFFMTWCCFLFFFSI